MVAVDWMYRRRGLLARLMHRQLSDLRVAGREAIAVLWASEARIYHRYGYGLAASCLNILADLREVRPLGTQAQTASLLRPSPFSRCPSSDGFTS